MTTHTVIEKKGKDLNVDDVVWYAQEWKKLSKTDRGYSVLQGMLALEYPNDLFLVRIPSSPIPTETVNNRLVELPEMTDLQIENELEKNHVLRGNSWTLKGAIAGVKIYKKYVSALSSVPSSPTNK